MNLTYRGQAYTSSKLMVDVNPQSAFSYRGQSYQRAAMINVTLKAKLAYRGVS